MCTKISVVNLVFSLLDCVGFWRLWATHKQSYVICPTSYWSAEISLKTVFFKHIVFEFLFVWASAKDLHVPLVLFQYKGCKQEIRQMFTQMDIKGFVADMLNLFFESDEDIFDLED